VSQSTHWNGLDRCIRQQQTAAILNFFLGALGVDHFYAGNIGYGCGKLFTAGGLGFWWLVDIFHWMSGGRYGTRGCPVK